MASGSSKGSAKRATPQKLPEVCKRGDPTPEVIYEAAGYALSRWEVLQEMIAQIFYLLVDAEQMDSLTKIAMRRVYGFLTTIKGQADAIMAAHNARIPLDKDRPLRDRINDLLKTARKEANKRNNIAHGIIYGIFAEPVGADPIAFAAHGGPIDKVQVTYKGETRDVPLMWLLAPPAYNAARNKLPTSFLSGNEELQDYRYNAAKIRQITDTWDRLISDATQLVVDIPAAKNRADEAFRKALGL
jgi:hypothetical protein